MTYNVYMYECMHLHVHVHVDKYMYMYKSMYVHVHSGRFVSLSLHCISATLRNEPKSEK